MIIMAKATREGSATRGSKSIPGRPADPLGGADLTTLEPLKVELDAIKCPRVRDKK
jgi:hypothetical protein